MKNEPVRRDVRALEGWLVPLDPLWTRHDLTVGLHLVLSWFAPAGGLLLNA